MRVQYQVVEWAGELATADEEGFWYAHGYRGYDKEEAEKSLSHMREVYTKYGRVFAMRMRDVGDWVIRG